MRKRKIHWAQLVLSVTLCCAVVALAVFGLFSCKQAQEREAQGTPGITTAFPTAAASATVLVTATAAPTPTTAEEPTATARATEATTPAPQVTPDAEKVVYLTFDDGPSSTITPKILAVLREKNVKATFFMVGREAERHLDIVKQVHDEGHVIGNHTYSHDYSKCYKSPEAFLEELHHQEEVIRKAVPDHNSKIMRMPGGSSYESRRPYREPALAEGYEAHDWNCLTGDAEGLKTAEAQKKYFRETIAGKKKVTVLMHDFMNADLTPEVTAYVIDYCREHGYRFGVFGQGETMP